MQLSSSRRLLIRGLAIFFLILIGFAIAPRAALAQDIFQGDQLGSSEVIDNDVIMSGDVVLLAGTVKGNAFVTGRDIIIDGNIEGSLFAIGQRITINGRIDGSAYTVALSSRLASTGEVGQNLYFVGVSFVSERGSQVGRDLVGLSLGAILQGSVGRDTKLIAGLLQFLNLFFDFALGPSPSPILASAIGRAPGLGQFILPGDIVVDVIGQTVDPGQAAQPPQTQAQLTADWFLARLREFLPLLIVGLIVYWFWRERLEESAHVIRSRPLASLGIGLVGLVIAGAVVGAFILVFILILMTGIWIGRVSFWNLSWLLWSIAFPFTALIFSLFMAFLSYATKGITTYAMTTAVIERFAPRLGRYRWLLLVIGLIIYVFLRAIPTLGWVISIVVTAWGIGAAWLAWRGRRAFFQPVVVAEAAGANPETAGSPPKGELSDDES